MTWLVLLSLGMGLIAQLIGSVYYDEWNGWGNCLIVISLGLISLLGVTSDIQDEEFEKKY